jgi:ABC-type sugar transport system ATPase subunit
MGTSGINLIEGWISDNLIRPFNISTVFIPPEYSLRDLVVGIRPEDIVTDEHGEHSGEIKRIEYLGDKSILSVQFLEYMMAILTESRSCSIGDTIRFSVRSDKVHLFDKETGICFTS